MTASTQPDRRRQAAFTLIELLVVMGIITVLAALIYPTAKGIKASATRKKVKAELQQVETALESYKAKYGLYPPDNPASPTSTYNQLYFELTGTKIIGTEYQTLNGDIKIPINQVQLAFGPAVGGFVNCTKGASTDDAVEAVNFLKMLKPSQYVEGAANGVTIRILCSSVQWPKNLGSLTPLSPTEPDVNPNPICYNSSSPRHNPTSYDLWVDVFIGGKTNRISNWSEKPQFVNYP